MLRIGEAVLGIGLLILVLTDAIQTVVVARHARAIPLLSRTLLGGGWRLFASIVRIACPDRRRQGWLGIYGPLVLLVLLGAWASGLILAFALLQFSIVRAGGVASAGFATELYFSAASFFTLGASPPQIPLARDLMVVEAGTGLSFLGLVIGYLPALYQSYASRELRILLLDARAGSPPTAVGFLLHAGSNPDRLETRLAGWEEWALDLLQSHLSYPMLAYFRSQHANQSWLGALTAMMDASALLMLGAEGTLRDQAGFTFAAGRHALVHTAAIFGAQPPSHRERLPAGGFGQLIEALAGTGSYLSRDSIVEAKLTEYRALYEPAAEALGAVFLLALPPWVPGEDIAANWQLASWGP